LKSNELARQAVLFGGNATIDGVVRHDVVCFGGNIVINGIVGGSLVTFGGNVVLNDGAKVGGDIVPIGGNVKTSPTSEIAGRVTSQIPFGDLYGPAVKRVSDWLVSCVFLARPLSLSVPWVWLVAGALCLLYLVVAVLFARPVEVCVGRLEQQPVSTFFFGVLTWILFPIVVTFLCIIVVGLIAVPFLAVAFVVALLIGKVALCVFIGRQFGRQLKVGWFDSLLMGFLFGWVLTTALYLVPVLGGLTFFVVGIWALGAATVAAFGGMRRERPPRTNGTNGTKAALASIPVATPAAPTIPTGTPIPGMPLTTAPASDASLPPLVTSTTQVSPADTLLMPRAELWPRVCAAFLDLVIVAFLSGYVRLPWFGHPGFPIVSIAYFAGMIAWKGTTVGGIVLNLKVLRLDGQPVAFAVALVRALMAWLSAAVFFVGFLWISWDREKQSWHDKIAGTVVVRVPRTQPLL
jgi:uncharacterized RDD family membrane protein YckC